MRFVLRSKIHKATVTDANPNYIGSITIDEALIKKVDMWSEEKVLVVDNTNGARLETYVMVGEENSGVICMNGASAHLIKKGDNITIMGFELTEKPVESKKVLVDENNKFVKFL